MLLRIEIIFRRWNLLANGYFTVFLILTLVTKLSWYSPIWPWGYWHVGGVLGCLLLLIFVHFTCHIHLTLKGWVVRLLTVLVRRSLVKLGTYCFLKNDSSSIGSISLLSECGRVHPSCSSWVNCSFLNHLVKISVVILDYGSMVISRLLERDHCSILGSNNLLLNTIVDGLIAMSSNGGSILDAVRTDTANTSRVNAIGIS